MADVPALILASASPRRKALLEALGLQISVQPSAAEEIFEGVPEEIVVVNARAKCLEIVEKQTGPALVIAADTLVFADRHVLGKPTDLDEARKMVRMLSGRSHEVITGLCVHDTAAGRRAEGFESTRVTFRELSDEEIDRFVDAVNPVDRAGAYTVDGPGSLIIESYVGCHYNVLGLPVVRLDRILRNLGYSLFDLMDSKRARFL
jgi:septum formation protein